MREWDSQVSTGPDRLPEPLLAPGPSSPTQVEMPQFALDIRESVGEVQEEDPFLTPQIKPAGKTHSSSDAGAQNKVDKDALTKATAISHLESHLRSMGEALTPSIVFRSLMGLAPAKVTHDRCFRKHRNEPLTNMNRATILQERRRQEICRIVAAKDKRIKFNTTLFRLDKWEAYRRAMQRVSNVDLKCSKLQAEQYLHQQFDNREDQSDIEIPPFLPRVPFTMDDAPISVEEVREILIKKRNASAPGADHITNAMLKDACANDFIATKFAWALDQVFNGSATIPEAWTNIRVRMIPKSDTASATNIDEFRPIAIGSTVCKILHAVLAKRILAHCDAHNVIDKRVQKGFLPRISGCVDHMMSLQHLLRESKRQGKGLEILLVDIRSAYNSVPHSKLWTVLAHVGVNSKVINHLQRIYRSSFMTISTKGWSTLPVKVGQGVLQGDTLSPLLFNVFFEVVLHAGLTNQRTCGVTVNQHRHFLKAYADDLTVVCNNEAHLRQTWQDLKRGFAWSRLAPNPNKCRIISMDCGRMTARSVPFEIETGLLIPCGLLDEGAQFLGLNVKMSQEPNSRLISRFLSQTVQRLLDQISELEYPLLAKLFFYQTAVLSRLRWYFQIYLNIPFTVAGQLQRQAVQAFRLWANIPRCASDAMITSHRAVGIEDIRNTYRTSRALNIHHGVFIQKDEAVKDAVLSIAERQTYFNKHDHSFHNRIVKRKWSESKIKDKSRRRINRMQDHTFENLKGVKWLIGNAVTGDSKGSFLKGLANYLPARAVAKWIKLAAGHAPVRYFLNKVDPAISDICPLCDGNEKQNLFHVLNNCPYANKARRYSTRHDAVLRLIAQQLEIGSPEATIWADIEGFRVDAKFPKVWKELASDARPDILVQRPGGSLVVIELTIPFEDNLASSHKRKVDKYTPHIAAIRLTKKISVEFYCVEVGSRGYIANSLLAIRKVLGLSKPAFRPFAIKLASTAVTESLNILNLRDTKDGTPITDLV